MVYVPPDPPVTPYLMVGNGHRALDWYVRAFGAREVDRYDMEDGRLGHAMLTLANGGSIYVADEFPEMIETIGTLAPDSLAPAQLQPCASSSSSTRLPGPAKVGMTPVLAR